MICWRPEVQVMSGRQNRLIFSGVALSGADVTNAAVAMIDVVPMDEASGPGTGLVEIGKALGGKLGAVLGGTKQRLGIGVVVADARPGVGGLDAQPVEHRQHRRGLERGAVVAVQHGLGAHRGNSLGQRGAAHQVRGMVGVIGVMHLPAHDLAAVQVEDQVQVEPPSHHLRRQVGHVPAPDLPRFGSDVRGGRPDRFGRLRSPTVGGLSVCLQHAAEGGFAGQVDALVGQHGHDACWRHGGKAGFVGDGQHMRTLRFGEGMARYRAGRLQSAIALDEAIGGLPALEGAQVDAGNLAGRLEPGAGSMCAVNVSGQGLAIFEADHSPSPLLKIAATFFDSTSSAAVSARALSLRSSSRSSSLMRFLSARVACGLARASSGSASAVVALRRHLSSSAGYTPCSRHHALLPASSSAATVITASSRARAVQARPRAGLDCASSRQRSNVCTDTPISFANAPASALSGGNNRATALFLNASPYRAIFRPYRPQVPNHIGATTILTRGGVKPSYSRPRVSDDNAYAESLFRTAKYRPEFPAKGFADLDQARTWAAGFVHWYNVDHRHSGIRYVSPAQRHAGEDQAILAARHDLYLRARALNPTRWSGDTRNWTPIGAVTLNPERDSVIKTHLPDNPIQQLAA